ncbi:ANTAR domain-containing protein [Streptomyces sp. V4-01]|uniref:ANTAR domain-containing protein n=1 Tax=Actinacidiphila polyblastidii TaxID=3110430 RepID=A0ABU7PCD2_9ACTN|nr:ANTAR domain-containing protein [Streptomyces sp. V4-01]
MSSRSATFDPLGSGDSRHQGGPEPEPQYRVEGVLLLRLAGALDASDVGELTLRARQYVAAARTLGRYLILDLTTATLLSGAVAAALDAEARQTPGVTVAVAAPDPRIRAVLDRALLSAVTVYASIAEAIRAHAADTGSDDPPWSDPVTAHDDTDGTLAGLHEEIYGLRARSRSRGLIDYAQGVVQTRYGLTALRAAFTLLTRTSQSHNVPLRVLASAVVTAPVPPGAGLWFPGRRRSAPPVVGFLAGQGARPRDRGKALQAAVAESVGLVEADAGTLHLVDPVRGPGLFLEAHEGHQPAYCDAYAHLTDTATVAARAHAAGRPVTDTEAARPSNGHPGSRRGDGPAAPQPGTALHTVHAVPLTTRNGRCTGTLALQHSLLGRRLTADQETALLQLAADIASWHSWYQRTVVLDALEHLHAQATEAGAGA